MLFSAYTLSADTIYVGGKPVESNMIEVTLLDNGLYGKYCMVDHGQKITHMNQATKKNLLTDSLGKKIKLKTTIQVIRFFTENGWKLMDKDVATSTQSDAMLGGTYSYSKTSFLFTK